MKKIDELVFQITEKEVNEGLKEERLVFEISRIANFERSLSFFVYKYEQWTFTVEQRVTRLIFFVLDSL